MVREVANANDRTLHDLNIHFSGGARKYYGNTFADLLAPRKPDEFVPGNTHISVHCNPLSSETHTIKRSTVHKNGDYRDKVHITTGLKRENLYAPVLFRICGDLRQDRFLLPQDHEDELIPLGSYDPSKDQLRFMLVLSNAETHFRSNSEHPSNTVLIGFSDFTLTVIWSYFNLPSHSQSIDIFWFSRRETGPLQGLEWYQIYNAYTDIYMAYANEYFAKYGDRK